MKKIALLLLISTSALDAMEQQERWQVLPTELKAMILSYAAHDPKNFLDLLLVSKQFHALMQDPQVLQSFADGLARQKLTAAQDLFVEASSRGNLPVAQAFLLTSIDINGPDLNNRIALLKAAMNNHVPVVKTLLDHGAFVDVQAKRRGFTPLMVAARKGNLEVVQELINYKANLNKQDNQQRTALMHAVKTGHKNIVELLLQHNANMHLKDAWNKTARMMARQHKESAIENLLEQHEKNKQN